MKGAVVALILIGATALTVGGVCFGVGIYTKNKNEKVIENKYNIEDSFNSIDIDLETADLYFKTADDNNVRVECNDREKLYQDVKVSDNTLKIKTVDHRRWYEKYIFAFNFKRFDVTVYLPAASYASLYVKTATGNVDFEKGTSFYKADIKTSTGNVLFNNNVTDYAKVTTSTGNIKLKDFTAKSVEAKSSTGNLNLEDLTIEDELVGNTSTGDHTYTRINCGDMTAKASTGGFKLTDVISSGRMQLNTSTGGIKFDRCDADTIKAKTSTGGIRGTLLSPKIFDAHSGTGSVKVPLSGEGGLCELKSDTGDIKITIAE